MLAVRIRFMIMKGLGKMSWIREVDSRCGEYCWANFGEDKMREITLENGSRVKISEESYRELSKATQIIRVPENIKIERRESDFTSYVGIQFGEEQCLYMVKGYDCYRVNTRIMENVKPHQLIPCKREDLKVGDLAFHTDRTDLSRIKCLHNYCFILPKDEYVCTDGKNPLTCSCTWKYWYKVVPIEE